jgi:thiamine monophosphate synthase
MNNTKRQEVNRIIDLINTKLTWSQFIQYRDIQAGDLKYTTKIQAIRQVTKSKTILSLVNELERLVA